MFFDQSAGSWQLHLWGAQMIGQLRANDPTSRLDSRVADVIGTPFRSRYYPVRPDTPAWYWAFQNGTLIVIIDGSTTLTQGNQLVSAYGSDSNGKTYAGLNQYLVDRASYMIQEIRESSVGIPSRIVLFGHSLGGGIAQALHYIVNTDGFKLVTTSITYGSPRVGDELFTRGFYGSDTCRVMMELDPVPLVPPQEGEAPYVRLVTPTNQLRFWNRYIHSDGGLIYTTDGRRFEGVLSSAILLNPLTSLANWLSTLPTAAETVHSIATYEAAIYAYGLVATPANPGVTPATPAERTHTQTVAQIEGEKRIAAEAVQERSHTQQEARLAVPPTYLFTARKVGKAWSVFFQGRSVAIGPGKAVAKRLAQNANRLTSAMLRQGQVDPEAIVSGIGVFVVAATDQSSGISPTIAS